MVNEELNNDPEFASLPQKKKHAYQLAVYKRIRADCWKNESDEVKAEVQNIFDGGHGVKDDEENGDESESESETKEGGDSGGGFNDDDDYDEKTLIRHQQE